MLAVDVLVEAIVVARPIAQQERRRPRLARGVAARAERLVLGGIADVDAHRRVPAVGDRREPPIEPATKRDDQISGSGSAKYLYSPRPKPWRAITMRERKRASSAYSAASPRQASAVRSFGATAQPNASSSRSSAGQSRASIAARAPSSGRLRPPLPPREGRALRGESGWGEGGASSRGLARDQRALALDAPAVAGKLAVRPHHAMAGDRDRERVGGAGLSDRAHGLRPADRLGRSRRKSRSCPAGWRGAPARPAAGKRSRGCRAEGPGAGPAPR